MSTLRDTASWTRRRLHDHIPPRPRVLFVGINPGIRSAMTGHHFAGYTNAFWKLLYDSGLVPEPITYEGDGRLPEWGYGVTNLIARPSAGIDSLAAREYAEGAERLSRKVRQYQPELVALVGVTLYRRLLPRLTIEPGRASAVIGLQPARLEGVPVFVLPNPSGRNAHYSYDAMLTVFKTLGRTLPGRR